MAARSKKAPEASKELEEAKVPDEKELPDDGEETNDELTDQVTYNVPTKIRMLVSIASDKWSFAPQQVVTVGEDIDESTAAAWLEVGHAEEA